MTVQKELFCQLYETLKHKVRLADDKEVDVLGRGLVLINDHGKMK